MIRSTTSSLSAASTFPPSATEPHGPGLSSFGPRSRVPRLPRRAGSIPPFAIFGRQVDGAVVAASALKTEAAPSWTLEAAMFSATLTGSLPGCGLKYHGGHVGQAPSRGASPRTTVVPESIGLVELAPELRRQYGA